MAKWLKWYGVYFPPNRTHVTTLPCESQMF